tara:strand:+ start:167 stop:331 length:165 start_codon:yes stop_codon:yes gene_type:complete
MKVISAPRIDLLNRFENLFKSFLKIDLKLFIRNNSLNDYSPEEIKKFEEWCKLQ